jgi:pilus assembly protein Flp/PilA
VKLTAAQGANLTLPRDLTGDPDSQAVEMKNFLVRFLKDDAGATAIEYGLIAAGISVAIISVVSGLGSKLNGKFDSISTQLK